MRIAYLLLTATASLCSGCSAFIASRGKDLTDSKTREEVRAVLGEPAASGLEERGCFEEYRTRRKIATAGSVQGYGMLIAMTYGTCELFYFPRELYLVGKRTLLGQTIRVTYDTTGRVTGQYLDGESLSLFGFPRADTTAEAEQVTPAASPPAASDASPPRTPAPTPSRR